MKKFIKNHGKTIILYSTIVISVAIFYLIFNCPIKFFTGVCCPGCGMTRAAFSLLKGDFGGAFHYHPAVFIMPVAGVVFFRRKHIPKKVMTALITIFVIIMGSIYITRLLNPNEIVFANPQEGFIYKAIHTILDIMKI